MADLIYKYIFFKNIVLICSYIISLKAPEGMSNFSYPVLAGRILNRFSKDIGHMDELLPLIFLDFIQVMYQSCQSSHREEQSACFSRIFHRG